MDKESLNLNVNGCAKAPQEFNVHFFKNQYMSLRKWPFLKLSYNKITAATGIPFDQHDIIGNVSRLS